MNSTDMKGQGEIFEWAKKNEDKNIFEMNDDIESFYIERTRRNTEICKYQFTSFKEAGDLFSSVLEERMKPEITRMVLISAFKVRLLSEKDAMGSKEIVQSNKKGLPEFIYVF